jgi:hypothetical protein
MSVIYSHFFQKRMRKLHFLQHMGPVSRIMLLFSSAVFIDFKLIYAWEVWLQSAPGQQSGRWQIPSALLIRRKRSSINVAELKLNATPLWFPQRKNLRRVWLSSKPVVIALALLFSVRAARTKESREKAPPQNPGGNLILDCCFLCFFLRLRWRRKMKSTKVEISRCSQNEMKKQRVRLLTPDRERHLRESESFAKVAWHAQTLSAVCGSERRGEWSGYWPEAAALPGYARPRAYRTFY